MSSALPNPSRAPRSLVIETTRPHIMGAFAVGRVLKVLGWTATVAMGAAAAAMIATTFA